MYSLEYYKFKFRKCSLVADKRLRSGLKTHKHIAPSCLLRLLCFLNFSLLLARVHLYIIRCLPILSVCPSFNYSLHPLRSPPSPPSLCHSSHPFDSFSKEIHCCSKEFSVRFVRKHPFKTVTCALQTARQSLRNPPQK